MTRDYETGIDTRSYPMWARILFIVGPITLIALGLVWDLRDRNQQLIHANEEHAKAEQLYQQNFLLHHEQQRQQNAVIEYYMKRQTTLQQQTCVNGAQTPDQRAGCFKE